MVTGTACRRALPQKPQSVEAVTLRGGCANRQGCGGGGGWLFVQTYFLNYLFMSVRRIELENAALTWFLQSPCVAL